MLAGASKNAVNVNARLLSQICIKVNISTGLPSGAEKDTDLHEISTSSSGSQVKALPAIQG